MKFVAKVVAAAALAALSLSASAASITWGSVTTITSPSSLDQVGSFISAVNAGGTAGAPLPVAGTDVTFVDGGPTSASIGTINNTGNGGFYSPTTGNANLDAVLDSHSYLSNGNPNSRGQVTLTGLTPGQGYRIQVIGVSDDRSCCLDRTQTIDDGNGDVSGALRRGSANAVIGTFTADSSSQSFFVSGINDPGLSGYQVRAAPEPATFGLLGVGAMAFLARRRRA